MTLDMRDTFGLIMDEAFPEAEHIILEEADGLVERDDFGVGLADLKVDFGAAQVAEFLFGGGHELAAEALPTVIWGDSEIVDPAAVAFVASHDSTDNCCI